MYLWLQHLGLPPLPAYDPVFNWVTERAFIYGQRTSELPASLSPRLEFLFVYIVQYNSCLIRFTAQICHSRSLNQILGNCSISLHLIAGLGDEDVTGSAVMALQRACWELMKSVGSHCS
jgi:hypothetical protein